MESREHQSDRTVIQRCGLVVGLIALVAILSLPTPETFTAHTAERATLPTDHPEVVRIAGGLKATLALVAIMVVWWVTEAVPLPITALLPGVLLPTLHVAGLRNGALFDYDAKAAFASFANPVIYLFLAGFLLAGAMRKTGLDRRITLSLLSWSPVMRGPGRILLAVMAITAFLSMWVSNTATTAMMLPIGLTILTQLDQKPGRSSFGLAMMLGIAWSASIGGIATIVGSPPNAIAVGILSESKVADLDFVGWMRFGLPVSVAGLVAAWCLLMAIQRPRIGDTAAAREAVLAQRAKLGRWNVEEVATLGVFGFVILLWVTRPFWAGLLPVSAYESLRYVDTHVIGLIGAALLFIVPARRRGWRPVLDWRDSKYVDWGVLVLFGGGIALSDAMSTTGLTTWLADAFVETIGRPAPWLCLALVVLLVDYLTEVTSNTAVTSMMTPVLIGLAPQLGLPPVILCVAAAMASSLAFMLPVATPPNAIVFASGHVRISQMATRGFLMNLLGCGVMIGCLYVLLGGQF